MRVLDPEFESCLALKLVREAIRSHTSARAHLGPREKSRRDVSRGTEETGCVAGSEVQTMPRVPAAPILSPTHGLI